VSKTVDELVQAFDKAYCEKLDDAEGTRAGVAAIVRALRDEIAPPPPLQDDTWEIKWPTEALERLFNEILGSDAGEKVAGGSTREDGHDDAGIVLTSAPVTIKETIAGTVLRMEQGYTGGMNDICVPAPAERSDATAVCEWKRGKEDWLFIGCRPQFGLNPIFYKPEGACEFCSAPIKFTEAK